MEIIGKQPPGPTPPCRLPVGWVVAADREVTGAGRAGCGHSEPHLSSSPSWPRALEGNGKNPAAKNTDQQPEFGPLLRASGHILWP